MIDERKAGSGSDGFLYQLDHDIGVKDRKRNRDGHNLGPGTFRDMIEHIPTGVVSVGSCEDFVSGCEWKRTRYHIHSGSCVGDEIHIDVLGADEFGQGFAAQVEGGFPLRDHEFRGVGFPPSSPLVLRREDWYWHR